MFPESLRTSFNLFLRNFRSSRLGKQKYPFNILILFRQLMMLSLRPFGYQHKHNCGGSASLQLIRANFNGIRNYYTPPMNTIPQYDRMLNKRIRPVVGQQGVDHREDKPYLKPLRSFTLHKSMLEAWLLSGARFATYHIHISTLTTNYLAMEICKCYSDRRFFRYC